jgi:HEAT repeat protein
LAEVGQGERFLLTDEQMQQFLSNDDRYVRGLAARALRRIGTPQALKIVIDWLQVSRWYPLTTADSPF